MNCIDFCELCVGRSFNTGQERQSGEEEDEEIPEYLRLHQLIVEEIGKICRKVNQVNAFVLSANFVSIWTIVDLHSV